MKKILTPLFSFLIGFSQAQTPTNIGGWMPNGEVKTIVSDNDYIYLGGVFTRLIKEGSSGTFSSATVVSQTTGEVTSNFPVANNSIYTAIPDGNGGWYVGGTFTQIGGINRNCLAHILPNKTVDPTWNPNPDKVVYTLALSGNSLYVGGRFSSIGGQNRQSIAKLSTTGTGAADAAWDMSCSSRSDIQSILISGSDMYLGGIIVSIGGYSRNSLAKANINGTVDATWYPAALGGYVYTLALSGSSLFVGGSFNISGGGTRNYLAKLSTTGTGALDATWKPNPDYNVKSILVSGSYLYVGGEFHTIGPVSSYPRRGLARVSTTGTGALDESWNPSGADLAYSSNKIYALALSGTDLYVGGSFNSIGYFSGTRKNIAKLSTLNSECDAAWDAHSVSEVNALAISGSNLFIGTGSGGVGGQVRNNIARIQKSNMELDATWNPNSDGDVNSLAISGSDLFVAGEFKNIGGQARSGLAKLSISGAGAADADWNPNPSSSVKTVVPLGSDLYVGGIFGAIGGQTRAGIAKLSTTGTGAADANWNLNLTGTVLTMVLSGTDMYVGGVFVAIGGTNRNSIAKLNALTGVVDPNWDPNPSSSVKMLALSGSNLYVGGTFSTIGGQNRNYLAKLSTTTGLADANWNPNPNGSHGYQYSLALSGSDLYIADVFTSIGGQNQNYLAKLSTTTGLADVNWNPNPSAYSNISAYGVSTLALSGNNLYVGGYFPYISNTSIRNFAVFTVNSVPSTEPVNIAITSGSQITTSGTSVTFTATPTNSGTSPSYQWKKGTTNVGTNNPIYTVASIANGDEITCLMKSSTTNTTAESNKIVMTVLPTPTVDPINDQTLCSGSSSSLIHFTGSVPGTVFNWTNSNTTIGLVDFSGTGDIPSFFAFNNSNFSQTAFITVTPTYTSNGVTTTGTPMSFSIIVNPTPTVPFIENQSVCHDAFTNVIPIFGTTPATYNWTNDNPSIGLAASGTGDIPSFKGINTTNSPISAMIMVIPRISNGATNCDGMPRFFTITVYPVVTPSVSIERQLTAQSNLEIISYGENVTFFAVPNKNSLLPSYQWKKNNINVGTNSDHYTVSTLTNTVNPLANNDLISCVMTSHANCVIPPEVTSNTLKMTVAKTCGSATTITLNTQGQIDNFATTYSGCTVALTHIRVDATGGNITNLRGLSGLTRVLGQLAILNTSITTLSDLSALEYTGNLAISNNDNLTSLGGMVALATTGGLTVSDNDILPNLSGFTASITSNVVLYNNDALNNIDALKFTSTSLNNVLIQGNKSLRSLGTVFNAITAITGGGNLGLTLHSTSLTDISSFNSLKTIDGNLLIYKNSDLTNFSGFESLTSITGNLEIEENAKLNSLAALSSLATVGKLLIIHLNPLITNLQGLEKLGSIPINLRNNGLNLSTRSVAPSIVGLSVSGNSSLTSLTGLSSVTSIGTGGLELGSTALTSLAGLSSLQTVDGDVTIYGNSSLPNLVGLNAVTSISGALRLNNNAILANITALSSLTAIGGLLLIQDNPTLTSLSGLNKIKVNTINDLQILSNTILSVCTAKSICDYLAIPTNAAQISGNAANCASRSIVQTNCISTVLSVELISFTGRKKENMNLLTWQTATEINNKGFQVECLNPTNNEWANLGFVNAQGKAGTYTFTDINPLPTSYYRLRQIDNDGKEELSKVISISAKAPHPLKIYPNVVKDFLTVETDNTDDFVIVNLLGQQVLRGKTAQRIAVSALPQGAYLLRVGSEVAKFVKE